MNYQNDKQAFCLGIQYNFMPAAKCHATGGSQVVDGKYEPDCRGSEPTRTMILAHWYDHTNILIQYNTELNFLFSYVVTGTLTPDAASMFRAESYYEDKPSYVSKDREWFIWWDNIDSWIISDSVGWKEGPYWSRTDPAIIGTYSPQGGATGTATVSVAPAADYNVTGATTPVNWGNYYTEGTYEGQTYYRRVDGEFFIWWDGIDSWIISYCPGYTNWPYWKRTDPAIEGDYDHYGRAVETATVAAGKI
jgi:hypothetical protein